MASKKKKTRYGSGNETNMISLITSGYLFMILCIHPLFLTDGYFNLLISKYRFYWITAAFSIISIVIYGVTKRSYAIELYFKENNLKKWLKSLSVSDIAMICFLVVAVISTLGSKFIWESITGKEGRHNGLFLLSIYGIMYFIITRFSKPTVKILDGFLLSGGVVGFLGIFDYFKLNPLGIKTRIEPGAWAIYTSTIGNINTFTAFMGLVLSISFIMYCFSKENKKSIYYYVIMLVSFFAIMMGSSDNAYLTIGALFLFSPLILFKYKVGMVRYVYSGVTLICVTKFVYILNIIGGDSVHGTDSIINLFAGSVYFTSLFVVGIVAASLLALWRYKKKQLNAGELPPVFRWIWLAVIAVVIGSILFALYYVNIAAGAKELGGLGSYLKFSDEWGTERGFVWRCAIELFGEFPLKRKLFGYGPDTFGILMTLKRLSEMQKYQVLYNDTHNVYLQYLLTMGITGMLSYILLIFGSVVKMIKNSKENPMPIAIGFAILAYSVQAVVNIEPPIVAPVMLTLLMMGLALCRKPINNEEKI